MATKSKKGQAEAKARTAAVQKFVAREDDLPDRSELESMTFHCKGEMLTINTAMLDHELQRIMQSPDEIKSCYDNSALLSYDITNRLNSWLHKNSQRSQAIFGTINWACEARAITGPGWIAFRCLMGGEFRADAYWVFMHQEESIWSTWHLPEESTPNLRIDESFDFVMDGEDYYIPFNSPAWPYVVRAPRRFRALGILSTVLLPNDDNGLSGLLRSPEPLRTAGNIVLKELRHAMDVLTNTSLTGQKLWTETNYLEQLQRSNGPLHKLIAGNDAAASICAEWIDEKIGQAYRAIP